MSVSDLQQTPSSIDLAKEDQAAVPTLIVSASDMQSSNTLTHCRSCGSPHLNLVVNLGHQPIANALLEPHELDEAHETFPLAVARCEDCSLVQVTETIPADVLFGRDYPYFSSVSPYLLNHSRTHALDLIERCRLGPDKFVVEIASNDGYLLQNFLDANVPLLGIDPASGPVAAARAKGIPTLQAYFDVQVARDLVQAGHRADVILANNVAAHVSDINSFVAGIALLLKDDGIAEIEVAYLLDLVESCAFDTIYHEHFYYYSLTALLPLLSRHGLYLNDAQRIDIHGGSIRVTASKRPGRSERLEALLAQEAQLGMSEAKFYQDFCTRVERIREDLRELVLDLSARGAKLAAYGAAAKGSTLINFVGLGPEVLSYVVDRNPHKVGKYMPGMRLPIRSVEAIEDDPPDYLLLLAWNFGSEIMNQQWVYAARGGRFIVPVPSVRIVENARAEEMVTSI
jgi:SAM-dependent methyltransferase